MGVGAVVIDITDRKEAELRLQGVVQQLPVGVLIVDADGRVLLGNQQLGDGPRVDRRGAQLGESDFVGWRADGRPYEVADYPLSARSVRRGDAARRSTYVRARRSCAGRSRPARRRSVDGGEVVAGVVVMQDVTERKQATSARTDRAARRGARLRDRRRRAARPLRTPLVRSSPTT